MGRPVSVLIADDHAFSSAGLQRLLENHGLHVLPPVATGIDAVVLARAEKPDLAVVDYDMPGATGLEVLSEIRRWSPETKVAILTGSTSATLLASMRAAGVDGLFLKSTAPSEICAGLMRVAKGEQVIGLETDNPLPALSKRELQVLSCIAEGLTNNGIAEKLSISAKTVESHRSSLMRKMQVQSLPTLLMRAIQLGLISP